MKRVLVTWPGYGKSMGTLSRAIPLRLGKFGLARRQLKLLIITEQRAKLCLGLRSVWAAL